MRVVIRIGRPRRGATVSLFKPLPARKRGFWRSLASSAILHAAAASGIFAIAASFEQLFPYQDYRPHFSAPLILARTGAISWPDTTAPPDAAPKPAAAPPSATPRRAREPGRAFSAPRRVPPLAILSPPPALAEPRQESAAAIPLPFSIGLGLPTLPPPDLAPIQSVQPDLQPDVIRIVHPRSGSYDVVIVQSGGWNSARDEAPVLKGAPVFVVYLDIGLPKLSMLQFAAPALKGPLVNLADAGPLDAPYPSLTLVPKTMQELGESILIHGFVTAAGRFRDISILGGSDHAAVLLGLLQEWVFRPARRGNQPVEVEILLTI